MRAVEDRASLTRSRDEDKAAGHVGYTVVVKMFSG